LNCLDAHNTHTIIYFKDAYIVHNYDNVTIQTTAAKSTEPMPTADPSKPKPNVGVGFDLYNVTDR
jgi:hypothetical protein